MAKLVKQFKIYSNTTQQTYACDMYTTLDEVSNKGLPVEVDIDGVPTTCYVALGKVGDANATPCHILKTTGGDDEWVLKTTATLPYNEVAFTTVGVYSLTMPAAANYWKLATCGGAGGSIATNILDQTSQADAGGISSIQPTTLDIYSGGGGGAYIDKQSGYDSYTNKVPGAGGSPGNGVAGADKGFALSFDATYGSGDYGKPQLTTTPSYFYTSVRGGSGGYTTTGANLVPRTNKSTTTYTIVVGQGGTGYYRKDKGYNAGTSGFALVAYSGNP